MTDAHLASDPSRSSEPPDRQLLVCALDSGAEGCETRAALKRLEASGWAPRRGRADFLYTPSEGRDAFRAVTDRLSATRPWGVLVVDGEPGGAEFRVEMRAANRASAGRKRSGRRISPTGPAVARATAPVASMRKAVADEGAPVRVSSDAGGRSGNDLLYRLLTDLDGTSADPAVGLVHAPCGGGEGARVDHALIERGLKACIDAFADTLTAPTLRPGR